MSDSRRARTVRRLAGGVLLASIVGFAIARAGAQQQGSAGANVNVISGTGADGDWTLQRQNEPTMACSSRNPQNCLAGANDYRTVDIPFPTIGEKITGDAWLGWYSTKNGGLTWRTRLLPGYPQDASPAGIVSPLKGYPAGADPIIRPGTNGMFYYGGLVFKREEGGGSAIFVARFIDNNNQEGTAGEPIAYLGASIVHRLGAAPTVAARRPGRGESAATRVARRTDRDAKRSWQSQVRAGAEQAGETEQLVDKPWMAVDIPRAGATTCSIGGTGNRRAAPDVSRRPRVHGLRALRRTWRRARPHHAQLLDQLRRDVERASRDQPSARAPTSTTTAWRTPPTSPACRQAWAEAADRLRFNPNADINNDCIVDVARSRALCRSRRRPARPEATPPLSGRHARNRSADRRTADRLAAVQRRRAAGRDRHRPLDQRRRDGFAADASSPRSARSIRAPPTRPSERTHFRRWRSTPRAALTWPGRREDTQHSGQTLRSATPGSSCRRRPQGSRGPCPWPSTTCPNPDIRSCRRSPSRRASCNSSTTTLREDVSQLFGQYVDELPILSGAHLPRIRHTIDVRAAQADPGPTPSFAAFRLSQYRSGGVSGSQTVQQLEFNPPNLPIFRAGTSPFMGDYLDVATEAPFVRNGSTWSFNTALSREPGLSRHLDGQPRYPPAGQRTLDRLHAAESSLRASRHERVRSDAADAGLRPGSGWHAQSEHLHRADYPGTRGRRARQLTQAQLDSSTQFPGLRSEQCDDDQKLPPDHRQPAGRWTGVVQAVRRS